MTITNIPSLLMYALRQRMLPELPFHKYLSAYDSLEIGSKERIGSKESCPSKRLFKIRILNHQWRFSMVKNNLFLTKNAKIELKKGIVNVEK